MAPNARGVWTEARRAPGRIWLGDSSMGRLVKQTPTLTVPFSPMRRAATGLPDADIL